jgi:four helix bundle protein
LLKFQYFKFQIPTINNLILNKPFDLEERTYLFARDCRLYVKKLPKTISNLEDGKQLVRSSGSVGANYIEANEKLGDKDFLFRAKISRKEAKESKYWIRLLQDLNPELNEFSIPLLEEAEELRKILSSIITKSS